MVGYQRSVCIKTVSFGKNFNAFLVELLIDFNSQNMETEKLFDLVREQVIIDDKKLIFVQLFTELF